MSAVDAFDDVRALYQDVILDHSRNPRHMHRLDPFDAHAHCDNPLCGDQVDVRLKFAADAKVAGAAFEGRGCAISLASADLMAEAVRGRSVPDIRALAKAFGDLAKTGRTQYHDPAMDTLRPLSGVSDYPSRVKCAVLPWAALIAALDGGKEA